jgi:hypothetical protein
MRSENYVPTLSFQRHLNLRYKKLGKSIFHNSRDRHSIVVKNDPQLNLQPTSVMDVCSRVVKHKA